MDRWRVVLVNVALVNRSQPQPCDEDEERQVQTI